MKELKIIQSDDGLLSIETPGKDGKPVTTGVDSIEDAIEQIKGQFGGTEGEAGGMAEEPAPVDETGPVAAQKGPKLEDNVPVVDKKRKGAQSKESADWSDYSL